MPLNQVEPVVSQNPNPNEKQLVITVSSVADPKEYQRQYYLLKKDRWRESYERRRDQILARKKTPKYMESGRAANKRYHDSNKEFCKALVRKWKMENRERANFLDRRSATQIRRSKGIGPKTKLPLDEVRRRANAYEKKYLSENPEAKVARCLRASLRDAVHKKRAKRTAKLLASIGCSISELVKHVESQFEPWMNWQNHGKWHLDHFVPITAFNLFDPEEQIWVNFYLNIRPMDSFDNQSKQDTLPVPLPAWVPPAISARILARNQPTPAQPECP